MGDSEDPSSQGAALVESTKTSPQLKVDFLVEVAALLFIRFIATKEPGQGSPKLADCLFVQLVLPLLMALLIRVNSSHTSR